MLVTILVIILVLACLGGLPTWGYAPHAYGYWPSGILGLILIVILIVFLVRGLP